MKNVLSVLCLIFLLSACTHSLHLSHVSDFSPTFAELSKGKFVQARSEQFVIMGFVTNTNYVNDAYVKLMGTCPGSIQGITTQYSTDHGFFSWTNSVEMQGLCLQR
jgi:hypothetical protein